MANEKTVIRIFDKTLAFQGFVEDYQTASYQRSFFQAGSFTFSINKNIPAAALLAKQYFVVYGSDFRDCGVITKISTAIDENGKGSQILNVSGYDLKYLMAQRVIMQLNAADTYAVSGPGETVIKTLISDQCGPTCTDPDRVFNLLQIATDQARGDNYELSAKYTQVYQAATCCDSSASGLPHVRAIL